MPEGHTLHRLAREHTRLFEGQRLAVSSPQGRFAGASAVDGQVFAGAEAYGKHLFHRYADAPTVHVHLGLFGKFWRHPLPPPVPRDTVRMRLVGDAAAVDLTGPTACELVDPAQEEAIVARLGPDPIRDDAEPERAWEALQRRRVGIGRALLDQSVLAGVGNVYRAEVLFVIGLHPETPAEAVTREQFDDIWSTLVTWMRRGVETGRIETVADADDRTRSVYKQGHCLRCATPVARWDLAGRWAYACPTCQPLAR